MSVAPSIRNSWTKAAIRRTRSFPPERKARFQAALDPEIAEEIRRLGHADWIPLERTLPVLDALMTALDREEDFVEFWRELIYDSYAGGLFSQLIKRAATLGGDPRRLLKLAPQAWAISSRGCGEVAVQPAEDGSLHLRSVNFPAPVLQSQPFALLFKGALLGMLGFVGGEGAVEFRRDLGPDGEVTGIGFEIR